MSTLHDALSLNLQTKILAAIRMKQAPWNAIFSSTVTLVNNTEWPLTDGIIKDEQKHIQCAVEFKPPGHDKREYLTGLGQSIAYLEKNEYSLYILPEKSVDGFEIGKYITGITKNDLFKNIPIGVITYDDSYNILIRRELKTSDRKILEKAETSERFWAFWREMSPHELFLILAEADKLYDADVNIRPIVIRWLHEMKTSGKTEDPQGNLRTIGKKGGTETLEQLYRNYVPFINGLGLWDSQGHLSKEGFSLLRIGKTYKWRSSAFMDFLAKLVLLNGRHLQLMLMIDVFQYSLYKDGALSVKNTKKFDELIETHLESKGLLRRAEGRRTTSLRNLLQSERTLWNWLGLIEMHKGTYFIPGIGYKFKWERITELIGGNLA